MTCESIDVLFDTRSQSAMSVGRLSAVDVDDCVVLIDKDLISRSVVGRGSGSMSDVGGGERQRRSKSREKNKPKDRVLTLKP